MSARANARCFTAMSSPSAQLASPASGAGDGGEGGEGGATRGLGGGDAAPSPGREESTEYVYESGEEAGSPPPRGKVTAAAAAAAASPQGGSGGDAGGGGGGGGGGARRASGQRTLSLADVERELAQLSAEVGAVLALPADVARGLLARHGWSRERLCERVFEGAADAGGGGGGGGAAPAAAPPFVCGLCLDACAGGADAAALRCGHSFCVRCWAAYLRAALDAGGAGAVLARCPAHADGCDEPVTAGAVAALAPAAAAARWRRFELRAFVAASATLAWCPGAGCSAAVQAAAGGGGGGGGGSGGGGGGGRTAACGACGARFCFRCAREAHEPASCVAVEAWAAKCGAESASAGWIVAHTKKCPACGVRVEKNQGCNHMRCKNTGCGHEWCW